jgi:hypothetical protein
MLSVFILYASTVRSIAYAMICTVHPDESDWVDLKNILQRTKDILYMEMMKSSL